ncbi:MAG TPA: DNA-processing protein DprA, partial [Gemmatimonadales bacterium]|nr:DNA-processing protein DprA [Gemmatimonadales bacterium]
MTDERLAYVALALTPGIGSARLHALVARFGGAGAALRAPQAALEATPHMSKAAASAVRAMTMDRARRVMEQLNELGGRVLIPADREFPASLTLIPDSPTVLFTTEHVEWLEPPAVAIVGSRVHSRYGAEVARHLAGGCARAGLVVVSGMARGIDALAHQAALDAGGGTIGVLGNGLGVVYPSANRELYRRAARAGLLLTEFPPGERPNAGSFPERNRLISGLARVTIVVEARERSGALITVNYALRQGREAMAVPGPITSPVSVGCNRLIQNGAKIVLGLRDVLEEYGIALDGAPGTRLMNDLTDAERRALAALDDSPRHVDELAESIGLDAGQTLATL